VAQVLKRIAPRRGPLPGYVLCLRPGVTLPELRLGSDRHKAIYQTEVFRGILALPTIAHRFMWEDMLRRLAPIVSIGADLGVTLARNAALPPSRRSTCRVSLESRNRVVWPKCRGMLGAIAHRCLAGWNTFEVDGVCLGAISLLGKRPVPDVQEALIRRCPGPGGAPGVEPQPYQRDPTHYGLTAKGGLCLASQAKALLPIMNHIDGFPRGPPMTVSGSA